jgi:alginate production protein
MKSIKVCALLFAPFLLFARTRAHAQEFAGQRLKVEGRWTNGALRGTRIQPRDASEDPKRVRISGQVQSVDSQAAKFRIGPIVIDWSASTNWDGIPAGQLAPQQGVEVRGFILDAAHVIATDIASSKESDPNRMELLGAVTDEQRPTGGVTRLTIAGISVDIAKSVSARSSGLVRRADERRPDEQFTTSLRGRPLTIGGAISSKGRFEGNMELRDDADDDDFRFEQELKLEFFYPWREDMLFFLEVKALYEARFRTPSGRREVTRWLARDQAWLYWSNVADSRFSVQVGRQNFRDLREWWWDSDLDAVRLHYDLPRFHAELALAQEMLPVTTLENGIDPIENKVFRVLGHTAWSWAPKHRLDGFFLYNLDHSKKHRVDKTVRPVREDANDANLVWLGLGASGERSVDRVGTVEYIVQGAWVGGTERLLTFDENGDGKNSVASRRRQRISGWGFDSVLTWETRLPGRPSVSLGYAFGSGDRKSGRKVTAFRQTDLQDNQGKFNGEKRFRYYGELLRPELSNLHIWTAAVGFSFWRSSSLDLVYHAYRQVHASSSVRSLRLDVDPRGKRRGIGREWDAILAFRGWEHLDVIFMGSVFQAGSAFGKRSGNLAAGLSLEVSYNF